jgi:site-specific recombinase XerD
MAMPKIGMKRGRYGFDFWRNNQRHVKYVWNTRDEAEKALLQLLLDLSNRPPELPQNSLRAAYNNYYDDCAEMVNRNERSKWRLSGLGFTFEVHILPHLGERRPVTTVHAEDGLELLNTLKQKTIKRAIIGRVGRQRKRVDEIDTGKKLKNKTIRNIMGDLKAFYNWCIKKKLAYFNPVTEEVWEKIGSTKVHKRPIDLRVFDEAATYLDDLRDRAWYEVSRWTGMRKDESNRLRWDEHVDWQSRKIFIPGTKTEGADGWFDLAPPALRALRGLYDSPLRDSTSPYVFPGRSAQTKGKKIYSRRRMFERIRKRSAIKKWLEIHPGKSAADAEKLCAADNYKLGIHLTPKDLRDFFCTVVGTEVMRVGANPKVAMMLMRHTSFTTTERYLRIVEQQAQSVLAGLGPATPQDGESFPNTQSTRIEPCAPDGGTFGWDFDDSTAEKIDQNRLIEELEEMRERLLNMRKQEEKSSGGGRSRTYDAADMSRVL